MVDIQAAAATTQAIGNSGRIGSLESVSQDRKVAEDSAIERKEVERSDTSRGVGENVDVEA